MNARLECAHDQAPCLRCGQPAINFDSLDARTCDWCFTRFFDSWTHGDAVFMMLARPEGRLRAVHRWLDRQRAA